MMKRIEEIEFEVLSKIPQLKRFLQKPSAERMPFEIIEVVQILKKVSTFQRYFNTKSDSHHFSMMPTSATLKCFEHGQTIYDSVRRHLMQNSQPTEIYVLIEGKVVVAGSAIEYTFSSGMTFGEVEILFQLSTRLSDAKCVSPEGCSCIVINREAMTKSLNPSINIREVYNYFARQSRLEQLSKFDLKMLSSKADQIKYEKGEYIAKEGTVSERMFWVIRGSVSVVRTIKLLEHHNVRPTAFQIDTLQESDTFGQYYCLNREPFDAALYFENIGSCYAINLCQILKISPSLEPLFRKHSRKYPPNEEILEIYELETMQAARKNLSLMEVHNTAHTRSKYRESKNQLARGIGLRQPDTSK